MSIENAFETSALAKLERIAVAVEALMTQKPERAQTTDEERVMRAIIAIDKGANSLRAVAKAIGCSERTARRSAGIRRALEAATIDRTVNTDEGEEYAYGIGG